MEWIRSLGLWVFFSNLKFWKLFGVMSIFCGFFVIIELFGVIGVSWYLGWLRV